MDAHLATLWPASKKRSFLEEQLAAWQGAYNEFLESGGDSERKPGTDPKDPPHATDFLITIVALQGRHEKLLIEERRRAG